MSRNTIKKTIAIILLQVAAGAAFAQFAWIDPNGVRQYSDQPPPASIPKNKILKDSGSQLRNAKPASPAAGIAAADAAPEGVPAVKAAEPKGPMTLAEKNADYNKRKLEQAEKDRKAADDTKLAANKSANCDRTRQYARTLESGERISAIDKNGERDYMSDEKRAQEVAASRRALDGCK